MTEIFICKVNEHQLSEDEDNSMDVVEELITLCCELLGTEENHGDWSAVDSDTTTKIKSFLEDIGCDLHE